MTKQTARPDAPETADTGIFDAGVFRANQTGEMTIRHPITKAPTTWVWTIAGPGHAATVEQADRLSRKALVEAHDEKLARVGAKRLRDEVKAVDEARRENAEFFADRVLGWTPVRINGQDYPFSRENVVAILLDREMPLLYAQVIDYFRADESFMKRSAKTS